MTRYLALILALAFCTTGIAHADAKTRLRNRAVASATVVALGGIPVVAGGLILGFGLPALTHRLRRANQQHALIANRRTVYDSWFHGTYGYWPTDQQFAEWHKAQYGYWP